MTLRGSVQEFPLRAVLELLAQTKKTGELQLRSGDRAGALGIADGRIVTAVFGEEEPLIALGAIFALEGAEFEFTKWDDSPPANLEAGTLDDLLRRADEAEKQAEEARRRAEAEREAARKKAEEEREAERRRIEAIRALIPSDELAFRLSERAVEGGAVTFTPDRWRVVLAVNGERDVNAIAAILHLDHNAALTALAALVKDAVIETVARTPASPPAPPAYQAPAAAAYEPPRGAYEPPPPAYEPPPPPTYEAPAAPAYEAPPPAYEAPPFEPAARASEPRPSSFEQYTPMPEAASAPEVPPATRDWITPDQALPARDWTTIPTEAGPISEVAPQWGAMPETPAPPQEWITPQEAEAPPAMDDRLSALSGIFGPAPTEPEAPTEPPLNAWAPPAVSSEAPAAPSEQWGTPAPPAPAAERWTAPPVEPPAPPVDPWGVAPAPASTPERWTPAAPAPAPGKDSWGAPAPSPSTWPPTPPAGGASSDPWGSPVTAQPRGAALGTPEPSVPIPPVEEWSPPPAAPPERKKKGLFGFGREKPAPPPVAGMPLPTTGVIGSRVGMLAALANALIAEYNNGQYGKGRIDERIANLLMRVDEQADPIDRPLPIVDDRIDVEALERERLAESQALPYLALLVTTIFADAEKTFGKDKAKKGYKAAQKSVLLGDASALTSPELAGRLPRV